MEEMNKGVSSWNMGLATAMRLHQDILDYKTAYINFDVPLMYRLAFGLYLELESEFKKGKKGEKGEAEEIQDLITKCKQSLVTYNQYNSNIIRNRTKYPHRKQILPKKTLVVYEHINDFFLAIKRVMKRLDIHLPKRETDPSSIFGGTD